jgi:hypothetical protein
MSGAPASTPASAGVETAASGSESGWYVKCIIPQIRTHGAFDDPHICVMETQPRPSGAFSAGKRLSPNRGTIGARG